MLKDFEIVSSSRMILTGSCKPQRLSKRDHKSLLQRENKGKTKVDPRALRQDSPEKLQGQVNYFSIAGMSILDFYMEFDPLCISDL